MARTFYEIPASTVPDRPLRIWVCDTEDDLPQADSIYDGDLIFLRNSETDGEPTLFLSDNGVSREFTPRDEDEWTIVQTEGVEDDITTVNAALNDLATRVQILEDTVA